MDYQAAYFVLFRAVIKAISLGETCEDLPETAQRGFDLLRAAQKSAEDMYFIGNRDV